MVLFLRHVRHFPFFLTIFDGTPGKTIVQIANGDEHACVLTDDAKIYCVGSNSEGELGDGTGIDQAEPVAVDDTNFDTDPVYIKATGRTNCALTLSGRVYCWGYDAFGATGSSPSTNTDVFLPTEVDDSFS